MTKEIKNQKAENAPTQTQKKAAHQKSRLIKELKVPSENEWDNIAKKFDLNPDQLEKLKHTVQYVAQDIIEYNATKKSLPERKQLVTHLKSFAAALEKLQSEVRRSEKLIEHFLPFDTLQIVGMLSSLLVAETVLGEKTYSTRINQIIADWPTATRGPITLLDIEEMAIPARKSLGLKVGHKLFINFIEQCYAPISKWLELDKLNQGGAPKDRARWLLVYWLAWSSKEIIGKTATRSKTGKFTNLCTEVMLICGLTRKGIESAIPDIVRKALRDKDKHDRESAGIFLLPEERVQ